MNNEIKTYIHESFSEMNQSDKREISRLFMEIKTMFKEHAESDTEFQEWCKEAIEKLNKKLTPIDETYQFSGHLWKVFLGFLGFLALLGSFVAAVPIIWHLIFPPKL